MDFTTAIRSCLSQYATFRGRARRSEFWWFSLFVIGLELVAALVEGALGVDGFLSGLVHLLTLLPSLAVGARRLHDIGRSGWSQLLLIIPILGWLALVYWWTRPSTPGPNLNGAAPAYGF